MQTHYEHYLLGCQAEGVEPLSFWRFNIAYGRYQREFRAQLEQHWGSLSSQDRHRIVIEYQWLVGTANLVRQGEQIAEAAARRRQNGDEPGEAGTREPRIPIDPVLVGCAARSLPSPETLKEQYDWRV